MELVVSCRFLWVIFTCSLPTSLLPASYVVAQNVQFKATNATFNAIDTAVVGQTIHLLCSTGMFDKLTDIAEIDFQTNPLMRYTNGMSTYHNTNQPESHYETDVLESADDGNTKVVIRLTINEVNENDDGQYRCFLTVSGVQRASNGITLSVQKIPKPLCVVNILGPPGDIIYNDGDVCAKQGANVTLGCSNENEDLSHVPVILEWTRGDSMDTSDEMFVGFNVISFPATLQENGIIFTCTSVNSSYIGITHSCSITVTVISKDETCFQSAMSTDDMLPTRSTSTLEYKPTSLNTAPQGTVITTMITHGGISETTSSMPSVLVIGLGASTGFLFLVVLIIIAIVVYKKQSNMSNGEANETSPYYSTPIHDAKVPAISSYETPMEEMPNPRYSSAPDATFDAISSQSHAYEKHIQETSQSQKTDYVNSTRFATRTRDVLDN
ncbi:uncharacterized protein [Amphiura filiformis]|uniref:uncharacterized protein n=1 Tax=Amphiura filiformis TaxID=82378 RepID=UPI003B216932